MIIEQLLPLLGDNVKVTRINGATVATREGRPELHSFLVETIKEVVADEEVKEPKSAECDLFSP